METLVTAYVIAWAAVSAYVTWMGVQNRRLARRLDELETLLLERERDSTAHYRAA